MNEQTMEKLREICDRVQEAKLKLDSKNLPMQERHDLLRIDECETHEYCARVMDEVNNSYYDYLTPDVTNYNKGDGDRCMQEFLDKYFPN
jgi:hypothetical protein